MQKTQPSLQTFSYNEDQEKKNTYQITKILTKNITRFTGYR